MEKYSDEYFEYLKSGKAKLKDMFNYTSERFHFDYDGKFNNKKYKLSNGEPFGTDFLDEDNNWYSLVIDEDKMIFKKGHLYEDGDVIYVFLDKKYF